jgi:hypothetical protein
MYVFDMYRYIYVYVYDLYIYKQQTYVCSLYVYINICINVYTYMYTYKYMCIRINICINVYTYEYTYIHPSTNMQKYMYIHICICIFSIIFLNISVSIHTYLNICKYMKLYPGHFLQADKEFKKVLYLLVSNKSISSSTLSSSFAYLGLEKDLRILQTDAMNGIKNVDIMGKNFMKLGQFENSNNYRGILLLLGDLIPLCPGCVQVYISKCNALNNLHQYEEAKICAELFMYEIHVSIQKFNAHKNANFSGINYDKLKWIEKVSRNIVTVDTETVVQVYIYVYICIHFFIYFKVDTEPVVQVYTYMYIYMCIFIFVTVDIELVVQVYTYIHTYIYIYIFIYMYTYINVLLHLI